VKFSPDKKILASCSKDKKVKLWETENYECIKTFDDHESSVNSICFDKKNNYLASGSKDNKIIIWELENY